MSRVKIVALIIVVICQVFSFAPAAATLQALQPGMEAPDFSLRTITGDKKTFKTVRGDKLTVLVFWSTWSPRSLKVLERMQNLHEKYRSQGLSVVGVNADEQKISSQTIQAIRDTADKLKLTFPLLVDDGLVLFHEYGVIALPSTVILNSDRVIAYELSGYPIVGSEAMVDYVAATIEGRKASVQSTNAYDPDKGALRYYNLGRSALKSRRTADSAEIWFKKAIELDSRFVQPYLSLGLYYLERGDSAAAQKAFKDALGKQPGNPIALCELGMMLVNDGKWEEGVGMFDAAKKADESYVPCFYYSGYAYGRKGMLDDASKMFSAAENMNRLDYRNFVYQGRLFEERKEPAKASAAYRKALEVILDIK